MNILSSFSKTFLRSSTNKHKFKDINNDGGRSFDDGGMTKKKKKAVVSSGHQRREKIKLGILTNSRFQLTLD